MPDVTKTAPPRGPWRFECRGIIRGRECYVWKIPRPETETGTWVYAQPVATFWPRRFAVPSSQGACICPEGGIVAECPRHAFAWDWVGQDPFKGRLAEDAWRSGARPS